MTESEDFLTRWSRRKQDAKIESDKDAQVDAKPQQAEQAGAEAKTARLADTQREPNSSEDVFDLSKLPSLDSIGPATDIRAFLQPGVPEALSRAALRRAWSADPAVRDFIGLAENSWDFTASDGMHGFGALDPADAKRLLAQLFSEGDRKREEDGERSTSGASAENSVSDANAEQERVSELEALNQEAIKSGHEQIEMHPASETEVGSAASQQEIVSAATQQKEAEPARAMPRGHGRALPQ